MVAVRPADVDRVLARLDPAVVLVLIFGRDGSLISERARRTAEQAVDDPTDPFQLVRLDGDALAADPALLVDEAGTFGLFGARRAIWVKPSSRSVAPAVEAVLAHAESSALIVVEAGDLAKTAPLRTLCERSPRALACPCYADQDKDLAAVIDDMVRGAGLSIAPDARDLLIQNLGGNRLATVGELRKLLLFVHGAQRITVDDVDAVTSDIGSLALDGVVDAAFSGEGQELDRALSRRLAEGTPASVILAAALRHGIALLNARRDMEAGRSAPTIVETWRGLHFTRKPKVQRQLGRWSVPGLRSAVRALQGAVLESRRTPLLGDSIAGAMLFDLARSRRS